MREISSANGHHGKQRSDGFVSNTRTISVAERFQVFGPGLNMAYNYKTVDQNIRTSALALLGGINHGSNA
jgi:hypothetical protein